MFLCFSNFGIYTLMSKLWLYFLFNFAKKIGYFSKNWDFIVSNLMFSFLTWINILPFKNWSSILSKLVLHSLFIFRSFIWDSVFVESWNSFSIENKILFIAKQKPYAFWNWYSLLQSFSWIKLRVYFPNCFFLLSNETCLFIRINPL